MPHYAEIPRGRMSWNAATRSRTLEGTAHEMTRVNRPALATSTILMWMFPGLSFIAPACSVTVPTPPADIPGLIRQLAIPEKEWGAASRLQKLGASAAAALVAH